MAERLWVKRPTRDNKERFLIRAASEGREIDGSGIILYESFAGYYTWEDGDKLTKVDNPPEKRPSDLVARLIFPSNLQEFEKSVSVGRVYVKLDQGEIEDNPPAMLLKDEKGRYFFEGFQREEDSFEIDDLDAGSSHPYGDYGSPVWRPLFTGGSTD